MPAEMRAFLYLNKNKISFAIKSLPNNLKYYYP